MTQKMQLFSNQLWTTKHQFLEQILLMINCIQLRKLIIINTLQNRKIMITKADTFKYRTNIL